MQDLRAAFLGLLLLPAIVAADLPIVFLSLEDAHNSWGVLAAVPPRLQPVNTSHGPRAPVVKAAQRVLGAYMTENGYECFIVDEHSNYSVSLKRFVSTNLKTWDDGTVVLTVPPDADGALSLKTLARKSSPSPMYSLLAFGYNATVAKHLNTAYAWTSKDGLHWEGANDAPLPVVFPDHDDAMTIWHPPTGQFVDMQITYESVPAKNVFGHETTDQVFDNVCYPLNYSRTHGYPNGRCVRRVLSTRVSPDGKVWSADMEPYRVPDDLDPPELEFYRFRPFFIGESGRMAASVLLYAPSPSYAVSLLPSSCRTGCKECCHAPHMYSELFVLRDGADPTDLDAWLRPYRHVSMRGLVGPWTPTDVLLDAEPLLVEGTDLVWFTRALTYDLKASGTAAYTLPVHRLGGLTAPANAAFSTRPFAWPAAGVSMDAQIGWDDPAGTAHCDQGCQAYVLVELLDAKTGAPLRGFERDKCLLKNVSGTRLPLRWDGALPTSEGPVAGTHVVARIFLRAAIVHALVEGGQ